MSAANDVSTSAMASSRWRVSEVLFWVVVLACGWGIAVGAEALDGKAFAALADSFSLPQTSDPILWLANARLQLGLAAARDLNALSYETDVDPELRAQVAQVCREARGPLDDARFAGELMRHAELDEPPLAAAARLDDLLSFVPARITGLLMLPAAPADQRLVPFAFELPTSTGSGYVSASFAPNQANGCGATYDAVVYWPQRCEEVAEQRFGAFKRAGLLKKDIVVLDGGPATKVFLMSAGSGCVSIKKELVL